MPSPGLVHITTTNFSAVSSVSIDNCFSATYNYYYIRSNFTNSAGNNPTRGRWRVGGSDASGSNYTIQYYVASGTSVSGARSASNQEMSSLLPDAGTYPMFGEVWVNDVFRAEQTTVYVDLARAIDGNIDLISILHEHTLQTSYDGFTAYVSAGTITGSISVFGLAQ